MARLLLHGELEAQRNTASAQPDSWGAVTEASPWDLQRTVWFEALADAFSCLAATPAML